jgi:hypothetical protein
MMLGLGGSALAAWLSVRGARARDVLMGELADITGLVTAARAAADETALAQIDAEADRIFAYTIEQTAKSNLDAASVLAFNMALTQVRDAVSLRRRMLAGS